MSRPISSDSALDPRHPMLSRLQSVFSRRTTHWFAGGAVLVADFYTGPFLMFPILFVLPTSLAAWFCSRTQGLLLAVLLPVGRACIAAFEEQTMPLAFVMANAAIRIAVLMFIAWLVDRTARQTRELKREVDILEGLLPICMHCKRIRNEQQQWEVLESYISDRTKAQFSHGLCPECGQRHYGEFLKKKPGA